MQNGGGKGEEEWGLRGSYQRGEEEGEMGALEVSVGVAG